jgi:hypothetical protein
MMTTRSTTENDPARVFGLAVRGPAHRRSRRPCEDAWRGSLFTDGACIAVSDGLGSRVEAIRGSRLAVASAVKCFREWRRSPGVEPTWLLRLLEARWRLAVAPSRPADCAATCLFGGWTAATGLVAAALGDGVMLLCEAGGPPRVLSARPPDHALDETHALGTDHRLSDWGVFHLRPVAPWALVLATDGVADDLMPEKLATFTRWLIEEVGSLPPQTRRAQLRAALNTWPVPGHSDDKTVAVLLHP